jgi:hypothetical protein
VGSRASSRASMKRKREEPEEGEDTAMVESEIGLKEADTPMTEAVETQQTEDIQVEPPSVTVNEPIEDQPMADPFTSEEQMDTT